LSLHYRRGRLSRCDGGRAHYAPLHRRDGQVALNFRRLHLLRADANRGGSNGPRVHECVMRNRGHRSDVCLIHVGDLVNVYIIVDVSNINHIHRRIRDIHILHVALAGAVGRHIHFARSEREPRHASPSTAERHRHAESRSANEDDQGRRVHGPHDYGTWYPAPASADFSPASVVKWSKAPGFVFHPGPSPGRDPDPMPVAIRRPTGSDARGIPHMSVFGNVTPLAVVIQIAITDDIA
jgi:hypothetical protein